MKNGKTKTYTAAVLTITAVAIFSVFAFSTAASHETPPWRPTCTMEQVPSFGNWLESGDGSNYQSYCEYEAGDTVWIQQPVFTNRLGEPFTVSNPNLWKTTTHSEPGNIRNVWVTFEYYAPSMNGTCVQQSVNGATGLYNSYHTVMLTNAESNLSHTGTFDDAFYDFNSEIVCDEWRVFNHQVKEFTNDFGSSFSGASKTIGSFGVEAKNIYIRNIRLNGTTTEQVW